MVIKNGSLALNAILIAPMGNFCDYSPWISQRWGNFVTESYINNFSVFNVFYKCFCYFYLKLRALQSIFQCKRQEFLVIEMLDVFVLVWSLHCGGQCEGSCLDNSGDPLPVFIKSGTWRHDSNYACSILQRRRFPDNDPLHSWANLARTLDNRLCPTNQHPTGA